MFSNDKNIETIAQLVEVLKHYIGLKADYLKVDLAEKIVKLLTVATMVVVLSFLLILVLIYLSFALAFGLATFIGTATAFLAVAGVYFILFLLFILKRKRWIERPLVRVLSSMFME